VHLSNPISTRISRPLVHAVAHSGMGRITVTIALPLVAIEPRTAGGDMGGDQVAAGLRIRVITHPEWAWRRCRRICSCFRDSPSSRARRAVGLPVAIPRKMRTRVAGRWRVFANTVPVRSVYSRHMPDSDRRETTAAAETAVAQHGDSAGISGRRDGGNAPARSGRCYHPGGR
jgi:hypothetical protein